MHFLKNLQLFLFLFFFTTAISQNVLKKKWEQKKTCCKCLKVLSACLCVQFNPDRKEPWSTERQCDADSWDCDLCRQVSQDATGSERGLRWVGRWEAQQGLMRQRNTGQSGSMCQSLIKLAEKEAEYWTQEVLRGPERDFPWCFLFFSPSQRNQYFNPESEFSL